MARMIRNARFARIDSREQCVIETPGFIGVRPIRPNHSNTCMVVSNAQMVLRRRSVSEEVLEDRFLYSGGTGSLHSFTAKIFSLSASGVKILLPWAQKSYTPLVLGRG